MISINIKGISQLKGLQKFLIWKIIQDKKRLKEVCRRIAEIGQTTLEQCYAEGAIDGNKDYHINILPTRNGCKLEIDGDDVGFLEFGAGVLTSPNEFADVVPYEVSEGSWSREHEGTFSQFGYWWWNNEKYNAIPPTRGLHNALVAMENSIEPVILEIMGK